MTRFIAMFAATVAIAASAGAAGATATPKPHASHSPHPKRHQTCKLKNCMKVQQKGIQP